MGLNKIPRRRDPALALEQHTRTKLRATRWLRLHVMLIATLTLAGLWLGGALLRWAGFDALALRYALLLPLTYLLYLGLLRLWARMLLDDELPDAAFDVADVALDLGDGVPVPARAFRSDMGGDFTDGAVEAGGKTLGALAMLVLGVALGWVIDHWRPAADSLPHALRLLLQH